MKSTQMFGIYNRTTKFTLCIGTDIDPYLTLQNEVSDQGLHYLPFVQLFSDTPMGSKRDSSN